eukprot:2736146-Rhodomonas_salina.1
MVPEQSSTSRGAQPTTRAKNASNGGLSGFAGIDTSGGLEKRGTGFILMPLTCQISVSAVANCKGKELKGWTSRKAQKKSEGMRPRSRRVRGGGQRFLDHEREFRGGVFADGVREER